MVSEGGIGDSAESGPPVAVVVVVEPGSTGLTDTLASVAAQDYSNTSVLVIDAAGGDSIADQVAAVLPDAFLHRMPQRPTLGVACNAAIELVSGAAFFLFVTTDSVLDPGATSALVEELYRSNAGIVTPKFVDAADPRRLRRVGLGSDQFGVQVDLVEPGEFDQEQYDSVRDVFVAPFGVQLVRADLFRAMGGFDPLMTRFGADLDLCWRAHVAGARVVVVPRAVVRLRERTIDVEERRRELGRHRLRSLLVSSSALHLLRVVPLALALLVAEAVYSIVAGRRRQARDAIGAVSWNLTHLRGTRQRRKQLAAMRGVSDREVHALQMGGSARLSGFFRGQFDVGDRVVSFAGAFRDSFTGHDAGSFRDGFIISMLLGLALLFGARDLIGGGITATGQFFHLPGAGILLGEWLGDWRSIGLGGEGHAPTALGVLGVARLAFFWAPGLLDTLLVVAPIGAGAVGAWRLARPFGSLRGSALAAVAYAANPLAVSAIAAGRWDALVVVGAGPFLVHSALLIQGAAPFGASHGSPAPGTVARSLSVRLVRFGLLVAAVATFVPAVIIVSITICVGLVVSGVVMAKPAGTVRLAMASAVAVVAPAALHAPWTFEILRRFEWSWFVGPESPAATFDSLADLIRFAPGSADPKLLTLGILAAASLALLIGNGVRLDGGIRAWTLAVVSWLLVWADRRGWVPADLPVAEMMLVPAAVGLSMAVGAATRSVEIDLVGFRFGWRQVSAFLGVAAIAGAGLLLLRQSYSGRWDMPEQSYLSTTALLADGLDGPTRILWIGPPSVLPVDSTETARGISWAVTDGGRSTVLGRWSPGIYGRNAEIGEQLDRAVDAETVRIGRLLAPYGIDFVAVVPTLAPAPYDGPVFEAPAGVLAALGAQLDLQRIPGVADFTVFRNEAAHGPVVGLADDVTDLGNAPAVFLDTDLTDGLRLDADTEPGQWSWRVPATDDTEVPDPVGVLVSVTGDGWVSDTEGVTVTPTAGGLLSLSPGGATEWSIHRPTPWLRWIVLVGQAVLVAAGVAVARSEDVRS